MARFGRCTIFDKRDQVSQPTLSALPPPPPGRAGWPWTEEQPPLPVTMPGGGLWPRISVVTPSYNQGPYLEETIRSVLLQGYPNLEYVVLDGGSTDNSVEIIRKYAPWLDYWQSRQDGGQSEAIQEGLSRATGEIFNWLNSDDFLFPGALKTVALMGSADAMAGGVAIGESPEHTAARFNSRLSARELLIGHSTFVQPAVWLKTAKLQQIGLNTSLHYAFDWLMIIQYLIRYPKVVYSQEVLVFFRHHPDSKTISAPRKFRWEGRKIWAILLEGAHGDPLQNIIARSADRARWGELLEAWRTNRRPIRRLCLFLSLIASRPGTRLDRFTLGALRRVIVGSFR